MSESMVLSPVDIPDAEHQDTVRSVPSNDPTCRVCGKPLQYGGRGRMPVYCDEHRKNKGAAPKRTTARGGSNSADVDAAVSALDTLYSLIGTGLFMMGAQQSASEMAQAAVRLKKSNADFLASDPELVRMLNRGGAATGRVGFLVSNAVLLVPVIAGGVQEIAARRAHDI